MSSIERYASATSVSPGEQLDFMVSYDHGAATSDFTIDFYRQGAGEVPVGNQLHEQADAYPTPPTYNSSGCGWPPVAVPLIVPHNWTTGVYRARLTGSSGDTSDILFVVKAGNPGTTSPVLLAVTLTTYQAYNAWGGTSLYTDPRSVTVTFDRPGDHVGFMSSLGERDFIRWLENNNLAIEYCTSIDLHANPSLLNSYQLLLSVGHDEYWSWEMRDNVEAFIANGGNVAFFSGNVCWWQVRFESNTRTMVCYKSDEHPDTPDPLLKTSRATIHWSESPVSRPENHMTGVSFRNGAGWWDPWPAGQPFPSYVVQDSQHWVFAGTGLSSGDGFGSAAEIIWQETDAAKFVQQNGVPRVTGEDGTPLSFSILALADLRNWKNAQGWATVGAYRTNGGTVFTGATIGWARGLQAPDKFVAQITTNVITGLRKPGVVTGQVFSGGSGVIYAVAANGDLYWYKDLVENGTTSWANAGAGKKIGNGWNFRQVFSGRGGVIYAIDLNGDLYWYKDLAQDGTTSWAFGGSGQKIGSGWNYRQVFGGSSGVIYGIAANGDLYWYKDLARDGTASWAFGGSGQKIGSGWNFRQVLAGEGGVIYAVTPGGDLYWYKDLAGDGTINWANGGTGQKIGSDWNFRQVFAGEVGVLYAIDLKGDLWWYKDLGENGKANWANGGVGQRIGNGWNF